MYNIFLRRNKMNRKRERTRLARQAKREKAEVSKFVSEIIQTVATTNAEKEAEEKPKEAEEAEEKPKEAEEKPKEAKEAEEQKTDQEPQKVNKEDGQQQALQKAGFFLRVLSAVASVGYAIGSAIATTVKGVVHLLVVSPVKFVFGFITGTGSNQEAKNSNNVATNQMGSHASTDYVSKLTHDRQEENKEKGQSI